MARDLREYGINMGTLVVSGPSSQEVVVPFAGELVELIFGTTTALTANDAELTIAVDGVNLSTTVTLVHSGSAVGDSNTYTFPLDGVADGSYVTVTSDGGPGAGAGVITLVVRR